MDQFGFDDKAKIWAGALYEVLSRSDALEKYKDHFDVPPPSYEGDTSGGGSITPGGAGGSGNNAIDISAFVSPGTKNNLDLAAYAVQAWESGWGYVWGTYGNVLTRSLFDYKLQQYPDGVGKYADFIRNNLAGPPDGGLRWAYQGLRLAGYAEYGDQVRNQRYAGLRREPDVPVSHRVRDHGHYA